MKGGLKITTISFNVDWLTDLSENRMFANENNEDDDRLVTTGNRTRNRLYVVKLVDLTYPIAVEN